MKKLTTSALLIFSGDAAARLFGFLAVVHLGHVLSPTTFGAIIIGSSALQYAVLAADLGLSTIGTREMARPHAARSFQLGTILALKLALAVAVCAVYQLGVWLLYAGNAAYSLMALYGFVVFPFALGTEWYFQGVRLFAPVALSRFVSGTVYLASVYFFVQSSAAAVYVPAAFFASTALATLFLLLRTSKRERLFSPPVQMRIYKQLITSSAAVSIGGFFAQVVLLVPPLVIDKIVSTADAGQYGAALKLMALAMIIDRVFVMLFMPIVSQRWSSDRASLPEFLRSVFRLVLVAGFSVSTVLSVVAPSLVVWVFGAQFSQAASVFAILAWFFAFTMLNSVFAFSLIGAGHDTKYLQATVWGGSFSVVLIVLGTVLGGIQGTAIAVVCSELCIAAITYRAFQRYFPAVQLGLLVAVAALSAVTITCCLATGLVQWWLAPLLWLAFLGIAWLGKLFSRNDIRLLLRL